jgi:hypothetical protein
VCVCVCVGVCVCVCVCVCGCVCCACLCVCVCVLARGTRSVLACGEQWSAVPFDAPAREQSLGKLGVQGIPMLSVMGANGQMLETNAVQVWCVVRHKGAGGGASKVPRGTVMQAMGQGRACSRARLWGFGLKP